MAHQRDPGDGSPTQARHDAGIDRDADFAGYDPYIVAITGGVSASSNGDSEAHAAQSTESRKVQLMAWLRDNGA